ncbi:4-hydroxybenzoate octaprenyltransferase [Legionella micdadei]|uniref:4-hydroxybenzoate octaprenyltransferase n=2 Tax=Legionella micdadei TaxID=451 RepID=A0A098GGI1_LEGMI|nr:4-hydroxybenzoate octaprenyltransferase [Legionella micdadei]ARG97426.1 4-hydroxybenzoate polyprenyltransferase [Legionella micdadei]ARH00264.1 4-hydroxybenzoate polyprenyltransferase [Legionella micdadei]KTD28320.1 4-hydroxybenzoate-octaprenyltransferase [Legionella micdadei]NSL16948.1 4-hydroxybenzoate octaprenyltransferase [Legionella micdadei]CEG61090.1 4-hydroxybenzoate octaprenyltransferase [Legionella micdadei]
MNWVGFLKLMRLHKPVGILLLWWPTAWALWIAYEGKPAPFVTLLFFLGTILMRSAGCVINDIADRHVDAHVKRTQSRPLVSGEIGLIEALILLVFLLFCAFLVLIQLPKVCFYYALAAVFVTILYPFCKRFIQGPQFVLGVAFSMGIPMVFAVVDVPNSAMLYLLSINFLWIIAYDTQYAMVDRDDDLRIGVKSTAILFAHYDKIIIGIFQFLLHILWLGLAFQLDFSFFFYSCWAIGAGILIYQQKLIAKRQREECFHAFLSNNWYGLIMWLGVLLATRS